MNDIFVPALLVLVLLVVAPLERQARRTARAAERTERKIDAILDQLGVGDPMKVLLSEAERDQLGAYLAEGKDVRAVKYYRERTGAGLVEAKEAVDRYRHQG